MAADKNAALRVSQLDAAELDSEILQLTKTQLTKIFKYHQSNFLTSFEPEISAAVKLLIWKCKEDGKFVEANSYCPKCPSYLCETCLPQHRRFLREHETLGDNKKKEWGKTSAAIDPNYAFLENLASHQEKGKEPELGKIEQESYPNKPHQEKEKEPELGKTEQESYPNKPHQENGKEPELGKTEQETYLNKPHQENGKEPELGKIEQETYPNKPHQEKGKEPELGKTEQESYPNKPHQENGKEPELGKTEQESYPNKPHQENGKEPELGKTEQESYPNKPHQEKGKEPELGKTEQESYPNKPHQEKGKEPELGKIEQESYPNKPHQENGKEPELGKTEQETYLNKLYQVYMYKCGKINVSLPDDKSLCYVDGLCQMPNGQIIVADEYNKRIKVLDSSYKIVSFCSVPDKPSAVCCTGETEIAVALANKTVQFIDVIDGMRLSKSINLGHNCFGIAYNDGKLYVTDKGKRVYIYSKSGARLSTIQVHGSGADIFSETRHIVVSKVQSNLYVTERGKGLVVLDNEGRYMITWESPQFTGSRGVCNDNHGNVFLICCLSHNIVQLDDLADNFIGTVVEQKHGLNFPGIAVFDKNRSSLLISSAPRKGCNELDVCYLEQA